MALAPKIAQLRGDFFLRNITKGEVALTPVFNATAGAFVPSVSTEKVPSNGNKRGTVFTYETERSAQLTITAQSRHAYMLSNYLLGSSVAVAAAEDVPFALPALSKGQAFQLPASNITEVSIPGAVVDVDFEVLKSGAVVALQDLAAVPVPDPADPAATATFSHGEYTDHGIFNEDAQEFEIVYLSEASGTQYVFYRGLLVPSGEVSLLAETGVGTAPVTFELSEALAAPDSATFGRYGRARSAV